MYPVKVAGIQEWLTPRSVTEVQSFVGFVNFYWCFVQDFSHITNPFISSQRRGKCGYGLRTSKTSSRSLNASSYFITSSPILIQLDQDTHFWLEMDASRYATGAVLSQLCNNDKWHPTGFTSKSLTKAKRNYVIHNKELLSVIQGLEEWRHVLEGAKHTIEILNDHRNLTYFWTSQNLNCQQAHWSIYLWQFDFSLTHRPGGHSAKLDTLSHRIDHIEEEDNQNQVMILDALFHLTTGPNESIAANGIISSHVTIKGEEVNFLGHICGCTN